MIINNVVNELKLKMWEKAFVYFFPCENKNIITDSIVNELLLKICVGQVMLTRLLVAEESMS